MATVKWDIKFDPTVFESVSYLGRILPEVRARALGWVGRKGAGLLYDNFLSGQSGGIRLKNKKDVKGHRTVSYSIGRQARYVKISSYPMNLFETGRFLRSIPRRREQGKHIILGKFKSLMDNQLQSIIDQFDEKVLKGIVHEVIQDIRSGRTISRKGYL
jgi:hypothetical protein